MNKINDGGPAFPNIQTVHQITGGAGGGIWGDTYSTGGMSLRAWFAGMAMQGMLSSWGDTEFNPRYAAEISVKHADALISELERTNP